VDTGADFLAGRDTEIRLPKQWCILGFVDFGPAPPLGDASLGRLKRNSQQL
jgi:hypothetical protein